MKIVSFFACFLLLFISFIPSSAQVKVEYGPALTNENKLFNNMLGSDENYFYCQRMTTKGKGLTYVIEKHDRKTLKFVSSSSFAPIDGVTTRLIDWVFDNGKIYMVKSSFGDGMLKVLYESMTPDGVVSPSVAVFETSSKERYSILRQQNSLNSKFLFLVSSSSSFTQNEVNIVLFDVKKEKSLWVKKPSFGGEPGKYLVTELILHELKLDESDNVFFTYGRKDKSFNAKSPSYQSFLAVIESSAKVNTDILLGNDVIAAQMMLTPQGALYYFSISKIKNTKKGEEQTTSLWTSKLDIKSKSVVSKTETVLSNVQMGIEKYSSSDGFRIEATYSTATDLLVIVEVCKNNSYAVFNPISYSLGYYANVASDFCVKMDLTGKMIWCTALPNRSGLANGTRLYSYVRTDKKLFLFHNALSDNWNIIQKTGYDSRELRIPESLAIHGSKFISSSITLNDGKLKNELLFTNEEYCWIYLSAHGNLNLLSVANNYLMDGKTSIITHTEKGGQSKFIRIKLD